MRLQQLLKFAFWVEITAAVFLAPLLILAVVKVGLGYPFWICAYSFGALCAGAYYYSKRQLARPDVVPLARPLPHAVWIFWSGIVAMLLAAAAVLRHLRLPAAR